MPGRKSVSEEDLVDLHGKVVVVTGGNTGIGYATIQMLACKGAKVYMAARSEEGALEAIKQLQSENINDGSVHWLKLELSDPRAAKRAAQEFLEKETRLDILGSHISHFAFTDALLPLMKETAKESGSDVRIVNVSLIAHSRVKAETFAMREAFNKNYGDSFNGYLSTYGHSKLANVLHIKALQKRLTAASIPITCIAVHPGAVRTVGSDGFLANIPCLGGFLKNYIAPLVFHPWRHGAVSVAFAAAGTEVAEKREMYRGVYIVPVAAIASPSKSALDERLQEECYETTEKIIADLS
ncbi:hypothetical protein B0H14DRAFT_2519960 [Mycena olivaceomarginata]|nr:hypothetical protein B0H14DRAFT_2519960 [Mycena olivaceomarginata]